MFPLPVSSDGEVWAGAVFFVAAADNLSRQSLAVMLHSGSLSIPGATSVIVMLSRDAKDSSVCTDGRRAECRQTENILVHHESENPMKNKD